MKTYREILNEIMKDEDVWNMSLEEYNRLEEIAKQIYRDQEEVQR